MTYTHLRMCYGCGECLAVCPHGAISHSDYPEGTVTAIDSGKLPSVVTTWDYFLLAAERDPGINEVLSLPQTHRVFGGMAMGYPRLKYKSWPERRKARVRWP